MKTIILRGIDDELSSALKQAARRADICSLAMRGVASAFQHGVKIFTR